jgi:hypothetical protein
MAYSSKPGADAVYFETGSPQDTADLIAAQDRARASSTTAATTAKSWAPWVIGGVLLGGGLYLILRD